MPSVHAGDVRLNYEQHGSGPEQLVFIHGWTSSLRNWAEIVPLLPARYTATLFDLRGAGGSDKPDTGYSPKVYAADIDEATRALGIDTFTLIGHSMGGLTAMQFAVDFPARLRSLVLVAPAPSEGLQGDPVYMDRMRGMRGNREVRRKMAHAFAPRPLPAETVERRIDDDLLWPEAAWLEAWNGMREIRLGDALGRLTVPTLMIAGDRDMLLPFNVADAARIPNCGLQVFYRAGHDIQGDVPEQFVAVLDDFVQNGVSTVTPEDRMRMVLELSE